MDENEITTPTPKTDYQESLGIRIKTASVSYKRTINLGDYNSAALEATLWFDIDPDIDNAGLDLAMSATWTMLRENIKAQALPILAQNKGKVHTQEFFLGLPIDDATPGEDDGKIATGGDIQPGE